MRGRLGLLGVGVVALATAAGCADLTPRAAGVCGNGVQEDPDEDCDAPGDATCTAQCRRVCEVQADCPAGWGCGADRLCERATGRWHEIGGPFFESVIDMSFADLDGDGRVDLVGYDNREVWAHLAAAGATFAGGISLLNDGAAPVFGDLDGDGFADAVAGGPASLTLAFGHQPRTGLGPTGQPRLTVSADQLSLLPLRTDDAPFDDLLEVWLQPGVGVVGRVRRAGGDVAPVTTLVANATKVEGVAIVDVDGDHRDEVVVLTSFTRARVFGTVDVPGGPPRLTLRVALPFPVPATRTRTFAADVTGDGVRDLVVDVGTSVQVAAGAGAGGFGPFAAEPALDVTGDLLALTDLDGDGDVDLIGGDGVWLRQGGRTVKVAAAAAPWTHAVVADFNRDGRPDIAALAPDGGIETLMAAPDNLYNRAPSFGGKVLCAGGVGGRDRGCPRAGDFDGDQFADVAFAAIGTGRAELRVLFGGPQGLTDAGISLGDVDLLATGAQAAFNMAGALLRADDDPALTNDAIADLVVQTAPLGPLVANDLTFFMGNRERVARAGYGLRGPRALAAIGRFRPTEGPGRDLIVQYVDGTFDLISGADDRRFGAEDRQPLAASPAGRLLDWCVDEVSSRFPRGVRVGDLDGDHRDELVGVACARPGQPVAIQIARVVDGPLRLELTDVPIPAAAQPLSKLGDVQLVDLDGDGRLDLAIDFVGAAPGENGLLVLWGQDGAFAGGFSVLRGVVPAPFLSFAVVEANGEPGRELLVEMSSASQPTQLLRIDVVGADRQLVVSTDDVAGIPSFGVAGPQVGGRVDVVPRSTDLDGDGVDDVVLATPEGIRFFLGCGRHAPRSAACP